MRRPAILAALSGAAILIGALTDRYGLHAGRQANAGACSRSGPDSKRSVADAARFPDFPLLYAGRALAGLRLTAVLCHQVPTVDAPVIYRSPETYPLVPSWSFIYGTCKGADVFDGSGCAPPVEIANDASCWNNLGVYAKSDRPKLIRLRGVPAALFPAAGPSKVELYTRQTTVTIFAPTLPQAEHIAKTLRSLDARHPAGSPLDPPTPSTLAGKTPCKT
jgi:hypothetical protein